MVHRLLFYLVSDFGSALILALAVARDLLSRFKYLQEQVHSTLCLSLFHTHILSWGTERG